MTVWMCGLPRVVLDWVGANHDTTGVWGAHLNFPFLKLSDSGPQILEAVGNRVIEGKVNKGQAALLKVLSSLHVTGLTGGVDSPITKLFVEGYIK